MQSKKHSLVEVITNTAVGFAGSWILAYYVIPWLYEIPVGNAHATTGTVVIFTVWSLVRGYVMRRMFNHALKTRPA